jgi:uncharacterized protein YcfL
MNAKPKQRSRLLLAAAPFVLLLLGACESTPRGSQNSYEGSEGRPMTAQEGNVTLARSLTIKDPVHKRQDGRLMVQFRLESQRSTRVDFAWTIDWFDQAGFAVQGANRHWEPVSLGGYGTTVLTSVAPTAAAVSWKLEVTSRNEVH